MNLQAAQQIYRAWRGGIEIPVIAYQESKRASLELAVLCAVLEQETGGGANVFGHDPTIFVGAGKVTKAKYEAYKMERRRTGKMQGVGPMQLTWYAYQDWADEAGGCWIPRINVRIGASILQNAIRDKGIYRALAAYNGSTEYADEVMARIEKWRRLLATA